MVSHFTKAVSGTIQVDESSQEQSAPTFNQSKTQSQGTKADALFNQSKTQSQGTKVDTFNQLTNFTTKKPRNKSRHIQSVDKGQGTKSFNKSRNQELRQNLLQQRSRRQELSQNAQNQDQRSLLVILPIYTDVDPAFQFNPDTVIHAVWDQAAKVFNGSSYGTLVFPKEFGTVAVFNTGAAVKSDFAQCDYLRYVNSILGKLFIPPGNESKLPHRFRSQWLVLVPV